MKLLRISKVKKSVDFKIETFFKIVGQNKVDIIKVHCENNIWTLEYSGPNHARVQMKNYILEIVKHNPDIFKIDLLPTCNEIITTVMIVFPKNLINLDENLLAIKSLRFYLAHFIHQHLSSMRRVPNVDWFFQLELMSLKLIGLLSVLRNIEINSDI